MSFLDVFLNLYYLEEYSSLSVLETFLLFSSLFLTFCPFCSFLFTCIPLDSSAWQPTSSFFFFFISLQIRSLCLSCPSNYACYMINYIQAYLLSFEVVYFCLKIYMTCVNMIDTSKGSLSLHVFCR